MFSIPWILTWFAHSISDITKIWRIYDYLLCSEPYSIIYVCAALIIATKEQLLDVVKEEPEGAEVNIIFIIKRKYFINLLLILAGSCVLILLKIKESYY